MCHFKRPYWRALHGYSIRLVVAVTAVWLPSVLAIISVDHLAFGQQSPSETGDQTTSAQSLPSRLFANAFMRDTNDKILLETVAIDPRTGKWKSLVDEVNFPRISPDGRTLAFMKSNKESFEIWTCDSQHGKTFSRIFGPVEGTPVWTGDSKRILVSDFTSDPEIVTWQFNADGTNRERLPIPDGHWVTDISRDGKWFATGHSENQIALVSVDGSEVRRFTQRGHNPHFSPDSRRIAFDRKWRGTIHIIDLNGRNERVYLEGHPETVAQLPRWSPDGKWLAIARFDWVTDANGERSVLSDPDRSHPRIIMLNVASGKHQVLKIAQQDVNRIWTTHEFDW